jgi:hypothetical protein
MSEINDLNPLLKPLQGNFGGIKSLEDYVICKDNAGKLNLRFSIAIANVGKEDLEIVIGEPEQIDGKTRAPGKQIIKQDNGKTREKDIGYFNQHIEEDGSGHSHAHWQYEKLASMVLVDENEQEVARSKKPGYCVIDSFRYPDFPVARPKQFHHTGCEGTTQKIGITLGWCDYYKFDTDRQYIEIENVPPGKYKIYFTINPTDMVYDIDEPASVEVTIKEEDIMNASNCDDVI